MKLVEGRNLQGLALRAGRAEEQQLPRNPRHHSPLHSPLPLQREVEPGYSLLDLRGKDRKGIIVGGHVHIDYPYSVRILRERRRRGCERFVPSEYALEARTAYSCRGSAGLPVDNKIHPTLNLLRNIYHTQIFGTPLTFITLQRYTILLL
jgi:hypothetical protein